MRATDEEWRSLRRAKQHALGEAAASSAVEHAQQQQRTGACCRLLRHHRGRWPMLYRPLWLMATAKHQHMRRTLQGVLTLSLHLLLCGAARLLVVCELCVLATAKAIWLHDAARACWTSAHRTRAAVAPEAAATGHETRCKAWVLLDDAARGQLHAWRCRHPARRLEPPQLHGAVPARMLTVRGRLVVGDESRLLVVRGVLP